MLNELKLIDKRLTKSLVKVNRQSEVGKTGKRRIFANTLFISSFCLKN